MANIEKGLLGLTGEYYVAAELGKRGIYAQLTLGNQKRTDLLLFSNTKDELLKVEVKCKQGSTWPNCKGINSENSVIIFVDFKDIEISDRPRFFILGNEDWSKIVLCKEQEYKSKHPERRTNIENNILICLDEKNSKGIPYSGCNIGISDVLEFKESWEKITDRLS